MRATSAEVTMSSVPTLTGPREGPPATPAGNYSDEPTLQRAVLQALAYADVFDFPLTADEIHRRLVGLAAPPDAFHAFLERRQLEPRYLARRAGYFMLAGREEIVATRRRRAIVAARLWPKAVQFGRVIAGLPFVRMVAVTGALAVDNVEPDADIDYLVVTEPGRLWLCRGLIVALVRVAARSGNVICPNYLLTERALMLSERTLYTAHEVTQMVPLAGLPVYQSMRFLNDWTGAFLPNAGGIPRDIGRDMSGRRPFRTLGEAALRTPIGGRIERWEMDRKVRKLSARRHGSAEVAFCADWCKGHFEGHGQHTLESYARRLRALDEVLA